MSILIIVISVTLFTSILCLKGVDGVNELMCVALRTSEERTVNLLEAHYEYNDSKKVLTQPYFSWADVVTHTPSLTNEEEI